MIERDMNGELLGRMDLGDLMNNEGTGIAEGYDAEGRLLNLDYPEMGRTPETSSVPAEGGATFPRGEGKGETALSTAEGKGEIAVNAQIPEAQTPAERLDVLAGEINAITTHARVVMATAAIDIGKRLMEARNLVPEGRWLEWLSSRVDYSERQAQVLMQIAQEYGRGELPEAFRGLGISHLTALLAAPAEDREAMAERVKDEDMSVRELQGIIKQMKIDRAADQMKIEGLEDQTVKQQGIIKEMDDREQEYDRAIVERDDRIRAAQAAIEKEREAAQLAEAKARAAEASAEELRRLHSDAEDRAAASAQRASDAVNRANQTAKELAEAKAKIQALSEAAANGPEVQTVEVVPEAMTRELEQLRRELAEARATLQKPSPGASAEAGEGGPRSGSEEVSTADPAARFREFYAATMRPAFNTALNMLRAVKADDANTADMLARAIMKGCEALLNQL